MPKRSRTARKGKEEESDKKTKLDDQQDATKTTSKSRGKAAPPAPPASSSSSSGKADAKGDELNDSSKWVQRRLLHKVALITGAGGAIGSACALQMAMQGAKVAIADMDKEKGKATVADILSKGCEAFFSQVDVSREDQVAAWVAAVVAKYGKIDILVNNAAAFVFGTIEEATNEDWDKVLAVNVKGYAFCAKYAVTQMKKQKTGGSIINVASISSFIAQPSFVPYNTSKGAILQLTRCLAMDHGPDGIRVNSICPGTIETPATHVHAKKLGKTFNQLKNETLKDHLLKRLGSVDDVAFAVIYLASDESTFVTGAHLPVDGGRLAH